MAGYLSSVQDQRRSGALLNMSNRRRTRGAHTNSAGTADTHPKSPVEITYTNTRCMALQPEILVRNLVVSGDGHDPITSAYKMLRTQVLQRMSANNWNVLAITSPGGQEGKTLTALNLAIGMAREVNHTVLLVELDLRQPTLHRYLGCQPEQGITDYLLRDVPISDIMFNPGIERLVIIPAGRPTTFSSELLSSPRMVELVNELKARYPSRLVLFDVPPLLAADDGLAFLPYVDAALLVVVEGETSLEDIELAKEMLASTPILGAVLNRASIQIKSDTY